jgi:bifunctional non-homologous end joining protein LigD
MLESPGITSAEPPTPLIKLTHPDRLIWKDAGVTKQGLADYYSKVRRRIAPFIVNRPLSLVRCPDRVGGHCSSGEATSISTVGRTQSLPISKRRA